MSTDDTRVEARASPLTDEEYTGWKRNIGVIAEMHSHPEEDDSYNNITVNLGMLLRVLATIDALLAQLEAKEKTIEALREWGQQFEHWTPEEHDAFLVVLEGSM